MQRVSGKINVWVPCGKHKNENSRRGVPSIFYFTLSPQRVWSTFIPRWYDVTVALPGRWKSLWCICGITVRTALFWAAVLRMGLWTGVQNWTDKWRFIKYCMKSHDSKRIIRWLLSCFFWGGFCFNFLRPTLWDLEKSLPSESVQKRWDMHRGSRWICLPLPRRIYRSPLPHRLHPTCVSGRTELYRKTACEGQKWARCLVMLSDGPADLESCIV